MLGVFALANPEWNMRIYTRRSIFGTRRIQQFRVQTVLFLPSTEYSRFYYTTLQMYVGDGKNSSIKIIFLNQQCTTGLRAIVEKTIDVFLSEDAAGPLAPVTDRSGRQQWTELIRHCVLGDRNEPREPA